MEKIEGYEDLSIEPEWCEDCSTECEDSGFEYEFNFYVEDGCAYCSNCRKPL